MLYEAAFWRPDARPPRDGALSDPALARYLEGWGRPGDVAVVAFDRAVGTRVGAAWYRLMPEDTRGFVAPGVPEVVIGVAEHSRGRGVGGTLLGALRKRAAAEGFAALSLTVDDGNPAVRLYERHGFRKLFRTENGWAMKAESAGRPP
jgi:ribosomal protein S18 acetylase RimI-like enzyme